MHSGLLVGVGLDPKSGVMSERVQELLSQMDADAIKKVLMSLPEHVQMGKLHELMAQMKDFMTGQGAELRSDAAFPKNAGIDVRKMRHPGKLACGCRWCDPKSGQASNFFVRNFCP